MNILFICPHFHNYEIEIINQLKKSKHNVYYSTLSLNLSLLDRFKRKFTSSFLKKRYLNFLKKEIENYKSIKFDRVVVIFGGIIFTKDNFHLLKTAFPEAKFIFYNWDSVCNNKQSLEYYKLFDEYYSFDLEDCKKYGYKRIDNWYTFDNNINENPRYDYGSLMTFYSKKIKQYLLIKKSLPESVEGKEYLVFPNKGSFLYNNIINHKYYKKINKDNIYNKFLPLEKAINFYNDCKAVIDVPLENQNGLTTRTFEVLKQQKKLITTNQVVKQYDFYTPNNIFVVDDENNKIPKEFFETPFDKNYSISENYSLKSFVNKLFDLVE